VSIQCLSNVSQMAKVVTLHWYNGKNGHVHPDAPTLAVCYSNGRMQIMKNESDDSEFDFYFYFHFINFHFIFYQVRFFYSKSV
jgi:hypothetical protein